MIDFPVETFVNSSFRLPVMRSRTSPFASAGYVLMYWLFDTGEPASSKLHAEKAAGKAGKSNDCAPSVIATLVGLPSAAESVAGKTSSAIAEPPAASSRKALCRIILVTSDGVAARNQSRGERACPSPASRRTLSRTREAV